MKLPDAREIGPLDLAVRLEAGDPIRVLDVRAPQRLAAGRVDPVPAERFHNIRGSEFVRLADPAAAIGLDPADPVAVVCGHGNDSRVIAALLEGRGYDAWSLRGGVTAWMRMVIPRELTPPRGFDRLVQFDRIGKGALGYLLVAGAEALAIDPPRDWAPWPEAAAASGARIVGVADTHVHADYISGAPSLARDQGVPYYLHPADNVWPYDETPGRLKFEPLSDGAELAIGGRSVVAHHTPGHTEGSTTFIAGDSQSAGVAFTGDFLFVDSIGRPDLAGKMEAWTGDLWRSLVRARDEWHPRVRLLPAHYAGEGERNADRTVDRAFGQARQTNATLGIETEDEFRGWVESHVSTPPEAYPHIKAINVGLAEVTPQQADILEAGKNECAVG
ncbi:MAG: MBL fold metallo-hydrolase [marine benthic group bacterium]|nr:MBL fold metallo-hydrolase [Gemmatimonadota bacterium]